MASAGDSGAAPVVVANVFRAAVGAGPSDGALAVPAAPAAASSAGVHGGPSWTRWSKSRLLTTLRLVNCCNGACLVTLAIISFLIPVATLDPAFDTITLSAYVVFLGLMMSCVELNVGWLQTRIRANFGFLFSFVGRTLFILFTASMAFAMGGSTSWLCWIVGGLTVLNGAFNALVIVTHPAFRTGELRARDDPWAGSRKAEEEAGLYLASRPDLVLAAVAAMRASPPPSSSVGWGDGAGGSGGGAAAAVANPYALAVSAGAGGGFGKDSDEQQHSGPGRGRAPSSYYETAGQVLPGGYGYTSGIAQGASSHDPALVVQQQQQQPPRHRGESGGPALHVQRSYLPTQPAGGPGYYPGQGATLFPSAQPPPPAQATHHEFPPAQPPPAAASPLFYGSAAAAYAASVANAAARPPPQSQQPPPSEAESDDADETPNPFM